MSAPTDTTTDTATKDGGYTVCTVFIADLTEGHGCSGTSSACYVAFDTPRTRAQVDLAWKAVDTASKVASAQTAAETSVEPRFDETWPGTYGEYKAALREHRRWQRQAAQDAVRQQQAETAARWLEHGGRTFKVTVSAMESWGSEWADDVTDDNPISGRALYVLRENYCRCGCGGGCYSDEACDDDETPPSYMIRITLDGVERTLISRTLPTGEEIGDVVTHVNEAVSTARAAMDEKVRRYKKKAAVTFEQINAMTFAEHTRFKSETAGALERSSHIVGEPDPPFTEDEISAAYTLAEAKARGAALGAYRMFEVGAPTHRVRL